MIYFISGLCLYCLFDFFELWRDSRIHEKIIFALIFSCALAFGIWFLSAGEKPDLTRGLVEYFNMGEIKY
jgi:ABC-type Mn2+/Zn2+ transport system permease subunit